MIHVLDEIVLRPERISEVLTLLEERYLPSAGGRGLTLQQRWLSPPVSVPGVTSTLWLLWQLPDAATYYRMRGTIGMQAIEFWAAVGELCESRRRHVMTAADQTLPAPLEEAAHAL